jgi:hypothetical protein
MCIITAYIIILLCFICYHVKVFQTLCFVSDPVTIGKTTYLIINQCIGSANETEVFTYEF